MEQEYALAAAVKEMNDTLGPEGLVPSALVFGGFPQIRTVSKQSVKRANLASRAKIATAARIERQKHMSKLRGDRALKHQTPAAATMSYKVGDQVLVWRVEIVDSRIGEWLGPFTVDAIDETKKIIYVQDERIGTAKPFNLAQVKRYY